MRLCNRNGIGVWILYSLIWKRSKAPYNDDNQMTLLSRNCVFRILKEQFYGIVIRDVVEI